MYIISKALKLFFMAAFFSLPVLSCKKFLDKKQNATLVVPSTLDDLQKLLDDFGTMNLMRSPSYGETSSDDYYMTNDYYDLVGSFMGESFQRIYLWEKYFDANATNDWGVAYQPIYNSNLALDILKNIPKTENNASSWNNIRGSALFYRSYYFMWLLWNYSKAFEGNNASNDPGIVLRLTSDFNVPSVRSSNEVCYSQVLKDTKASVEYLPAYPQSKMRPSKAAAYGLLARCYLSMRDYPNALLYADSCLQIENRLMNYGMDDEVAPTGRPFRQANKETVFYSEMNNNGFIFNTRQGASGIDTGLLKLYESNDLRARKFFSKSGQYYVFQGSYTTNANVCFSGIATDEIYLIRSECFIRSGQIAKGINDLNHLLSYRYEPGTFEPITNMDQNDALTRILEERRKELLMRGLRWMDIKRLNVEGRNIVLKRVVHGKEYQLMPNSAYYALPIPEDIIDLTGIPQNK